MSIFLSFNESKDQFKWNGNQEQLASFCESSLGLGLNHDDGSSSTPTYQWTQKQKAISCKFSSPFKGSLTWFPSTGTLMVLGRDADAIKDQLHSVLSDILDATGFHLDLSHDIDSGDDNLVIDPTVGPEQSTGSSCCSLNLLADIAANQNHMSPSSDEPIATTEGCQSTVQGDMLRAELDLIWSNLRSLELNICNFNHPDSESDKIRELQNSNFLLKSENERLKQENMTIKDKLNCLREAVKIVNEQPFRNLEDNWSEPKHPPKVSKPEHIFVSNSHLSDRSEELGEDSVEVFEDSHFTDDFNLQFQNAKLSREIHYLKSKLESRVNVSSSSDKKKPSVQEQNDSVVENIDPEPIGNSWQKVESRKGKQARKKQAGNKNTHDKKFPSKQHGKTDSSSTNEKQVNTNKSKSTGKKCLLLGDSHVRRLDKAKLKNTTCAGIGGLMSQNFIQRHSNTINKEIATSNEVIIHVGSNDIARNVAVETIVDNIDTAGMKLLEKTPSVSITISSILLEKYNPSLNVKIVEANEALRRYCLGKGWDYITHGNIAFKHLLRDGMHLNQDGYRLFAQNLTGHITSG